MASPCTTLAKRSIGRFNGEHKLIYADIYALLSMLVLGQQDHNLNGNTPVALKVAPLSKLVG